MSAAARDDELREAAACGSRVAADWDGGLASLVAVCVGIRDGIRAFGENKVVLDQFLAPLVEAKILTGDQARQGRSCSKLSMLVNIGEHDYLFRRAEVARQVLARYATAYQACSLFDNIVGIDEDQRVGELVRILARCPEQGAREFLLAETRRLKLARRAPAAIVGGTPAADPVRGATVTELVQARQQFGLMLLTPAERDLGLVRKHFVDGHTLEECLPLRRLADDARSAAIVVATRLSNQPVVVEKLIPLCGFSPQCRVVLTRRPAAPDVTDAEVLITASRGELQVRPMDDDQWNGDGSTDVAATAARLYPDAEPRLHVFASAPSDGWHSIIGANSWTRQPDVA
jgi:hypothetical protein